MSHFVFVYGTLKEGFGNHYLLEGALCVHKGVLEVPAKMVSLGPFPGLILNEEWKAQNIWGEYYQINDETLRMLDILEGYPSFYDRQLVPGSGRLRGQDVWVYHLPEEEYGDHEEVTSRCWGVSEEEVKKWEDKERSKASTKKSKSPFQAGTSSKLGGDDVEGLHDLQEAAEWLRGIRQEMMVDDAVAMAVPLPPEPPEF